MEGMNSIFAFVIGFGLGLGLGIWIYKKIATESEKNFKSLSEEALRMQTDQILKLAETKLSGKKEAIDDTLKTMHTELKDVETLMRDLEKDRAKKYGALDTRLKTAAEVIKDLSDHTKGLKTALSSNSRRGQWGERMAEDVLRLAGLVEGINYIKQKKLADAGSRPDFTFILPQELKLNMDVKFPFNNYEGFVEAETEAERERYKKEFLNDVKKRVKEVQTREYINPNDNTVDYVLLFIPNEQIFAFINETDRSIIDEAMQAKTILCSPLSLYAILAVIRQSIDNFQFEAKSHQMLKIFGTFKVQWEKYKDQIAMVKDRFEKVYKEYDDLVGVRERQLDKPLEKLEELRQQADTLPKKVITKKIEEAQVVKKDRTIV